MLVSCYDINLINSRRGRPLKPGLHVRRKHKHKHKHKRKHENKDVYTCDEHKHKVTYASAEA